MTVDLQELLDAQRDLQLKMKPVGRDPSQLSDEDRAVFITWNAYALEDEIHEATSEVGWKPWATSRHVNREAYLKELVDAFHFFMNLMLVVDITAEEFAEAYHAKRKVNAQRQLDDYDGVSTKCPGCHREKSEAGAPTRIQHAGGGFTLSCPHCFTIWEVHDVVK